MDYREKTTICKATKWDPEVGLCYHLSSCPRVKTLPDILLSNNYLKQVNPRPWLRNFNLIPFHEILYSIFFNEKKKDPEFSLD